MKRTDEAISVVRKTTNYGKFKLLVGNRMVSEKRKQNIRNSIEKIGYVPSPIICNESLGVVDGQARLAVCKEDNLPVYYIIVPGIGIEECISMNINQENWQIKDYIASYAEQGNPNYARLWSYLNKNLKYNFSTKIWAVFHSDDSNKNDAIKNGQIVVTEKMITCAQKLLDYFDNFTDIQTNRKTEFYTAVGYCYGFPEVDNERLIKKLKNSRMFVSISNTQDAISRIEIEYNKRQREHVYIETIYLQYLESLGVARCHNTHGPGRIKPGAETAEGVNALSQHGPCLFKEGD